MVNTYGLVGVEWFESRRALVDVLHALKIGIEAVNRQVAIWEMGGVEGGGMALLRVTP